MNTTRGEHSGLEALRRLNDRYDPLGPRASNSLLTKILATKAVEISGLRREIENVERLCLEYETRTGTPLAEDLRMVVVEQLLKEPLKTHVNLNTDRLSTYPLLRSEIMKYAERIEHDNRQEGPMLMDLDPLTRSPKGKGKKGTAAASAAGPKGWNSKTACFRCGREGHTKAECWSKTTIDGTPLEPRKDNNKGKGKTKGKNKGKSKSKGRGAPGVNELEETSAQGATEVSETLGFLCMLTASEGSSEEPEMNKNRNGKAEPPALERSSDLRPPLQRRKKVDMRPPLPRKRLRSSTALTQDELDSYFMTSQGQRENQNKAEIKANNTGVRIVAHAIAGKYSQELRQEDDEPKRQELKARMQQVKDMVKNVNKNWSARLRSDLRAGKPKSLAFAKEKSRQRAAQHRAEKRTHAGLSGLELRRKWEEDLDRKRCKIDIGDSQIDGIEEDAENEMEHKWVPEPVTAKDRQHLHAHDSKKEKDLVEGSSSVFAREWGTPGWLARRQEKQKQKQRERRKQKRQEEKQSCHSSPRSSHQRSSTTVSSRLGGWANDSNDSWHELYSCYAKESWQDNGHIEFIVDSGASASVITTSTATSLPLHSLGVQKSYTSASKNLLKPLGYRDIPLEVAPNVVKGIRAEVLKVHKNLLSVGKMVQNGCRVVFDRQGSYIETGKDRQRVPLEYRIGVFVLSGKLVDPPQKREDEPKLLASSVASTDERQELRKGVAFSSDSLEKANSVTHSKKEGIKQQQEGRKAQKCSSQMSERVERGSQNAEKNSQKPEERAVASTAGSTGSVSDSLMPPPPGLYFLGFGASGSSSSNGPLRDVVEDVPEGTEAMDEECADEPDEQEAGISRAVAFPIRPTEKMIQEHEVCHLPFRSWCPHCIKGRGRTNPQKSHAEHHKQDSIPVATIDLTYPTWGASRMPPTFRFWLCEKESAKEYGHTNLRQRITSMQNEHY